jgi:hypothetical protein
MKVSGGAFLAGLLIAISTTGPAAASSAHNADPAMSRPEQSTRAVRSPHQGSASQVIPDSASGCTAEPSGYSPTWNVTRAVAGRQYTQAAATTTIRQLYACAGSGESFASVMPVNLGGVGVAPSVPFLQIGYFALGNTLHFWAVFAEDSQGGGGIVDSEIGFTPQIGHATRFEIYPVSGPNRWRMRATDTISGRTGFHDVPRAHNWAPGVWYGIEVHNEGDLFGGSGSANKTIISDLTYQYVGDGTTLDTYLTGTGGSGWAGMAGRTPKPCWIEGISIATPRTNRTIVTGYDIC